MMESGQLKRRSPSAQTGTGRSEAGYRLLGQDKPIVAGKPQTVDLFAVLDRDLAPIAEQFAAQDNRPIRILPRRARSISQISFHVVTLFVAAHAFVSRSFSAVQQNGLEIYCE